MTIPFHKYEGLGNDFLLVDKKALGGVPLTDEQAVALCDRHRGVGADGVLVIDMTSPSMAVINADGSVPEMCGNGIRCVALHLARSSGATHLMLDIDTVAGSQSCSVDADGSKGLVTVDMSGASLAPTDIGLVSETPWQDQSVRVGDHTVRFTAVSMGNPHAVTFDDVGDARFEIAEVLQVDPRFPDGVNVGFVSEREGRVMRLDVCERGAGWTQACGTGAAAAAVAAVETQRVDRGDTLEIRLPGGTLSITPRALGEPVQMRGPARFVFAGEVSL
ncbi:MAG: diaminopimelate epimerase [Polyangiales bacterium]